MSETTKSAPKKFKTRLYIQPENNMLYKSCRGQTEDCHIPPAMYQRMAYEYYAIMSGRGYTHQDIISGASLVNRMPPKAKPEKAARVKKVVVTAEEKAARKAHLLALSKLSSDELANIRNTVGA